MSEEHGTHPRAAKKREASVMSEPLQADVAVIGAGIVGLSHAWSAAKRGHRVVLFDRHERPHGASVRNFGMVWPIGQKPGEPHEVSLLSRSLWLEAAREAKLWHDPVGSIHLAIREDEAAVLEEFAGQADGLGFDVELLTGEQAADRCPAARRDAVIAGLWSPTEVCVDPPQAIARLPHWLAERYGVELQLGVAVHAVESPYVHSADGRRWRVDRAIVCGGDDLATLFPAELARAGIRRCKLQMVRTTEQPGGWRIGPMIASGLTLRHYPTFAACPSLEALRRRVAEESPELDRYGIHVMASQQGGRVVLGDSHEYDGDIDPFDKPIIDELVIRELRRMIELRDWTIAARWHGTYGKLANAVEYTADPQPGVRVVVGTGGTGMTMSFGLAERMWARWS